jgi:hypothetical protein
MDKKDLNLIWVQHPLPLSAISEQHFPKFLLKYCRKLSSLVFSVVICFPNKLIPLDGRMDISR